MKRRQFIKTSIVAGCSIVGIGSIGYLSVEETNASELTISAALRKLKLLSKNNLIHLGEWNTQKILLHCAQSVEFSMSGFPNHKSTLFKSMIGKLAFSIFSSKGKMTHGLSEPIPGSESIDDSIDISSALSRLTDSLIKFDNYSGQLVSHFTYGKLSKSEYEIAHVMHLYNHLLEVQSLS